MLRWIVFGIISLVVSPVVAAERAPVKIPRSRDKRIQITLFAKAPQIVTPTGIDVDHAGRIWAVESNTHFRPEGYTGHASDRVLVMQDTNGDGTADNITTFTDGLKYTMSVKVKPVWLGSPESRDKSPETTERGKPKTESGKKRISVYVATRRAIFLYHDDDGDLKADRRSRIVYLETKGDYPHNGLAGIAFNAMGWMFFGLGENLGANYKIIGSDGTTLSGGGEGGNIYRCRPDGSKLTRWATGFWNPHSSCFDAFGRLFTVDNDPHSRPPCRLLHVIRGGDYGYRYRNGSRGMHPFTSWNGEIPGTLPMVAGTGEAPSGIVAYESDGLPKDYLGHLLVTSWGDHRIDRFRLKRRGSSFQSLPETIIQGGENFRPVGLAIAPDGSLYCTDWVLRDYKLHGHGRVWKISMVAEPGSVNPDRAHRARLSTKRKIIDTATITSKRTVKELKRLVDSPRLDVRRASAMALIQTANGRKELLERLLHRPKRGQIESLFALSRVPIQTEYLDLVPFSETRKKLIGDWKRPDEVRTALWRLLAEETLQVPYVRSYTLLITASYPLFDPAIRTGHPKWTDPCFPLAILSIRSSTAFLHPNSLVTEYGDSDQQDERSTSSIDLPEFFELADPFLFAALVDAMARSFDSLQERTAARVAKLKYPRARLGYLLAARRRDPKSQAPLRWGLKDADPQIRRAAVQWVAEEHLVGYRPQVEAMLNDRSRKMSSNLFLSTLAALEMLDGVPPKDFDKTPASKYVLPLLTDAKRPPAIRAQALRLVDPSDPALTTQLYRNLLATKDAPLIRETVRTLDHSPLKSAAELLIPIAMNKQNDINLRADAITGLTGRWFNSSNASQVRTTLEQLMLSKQRSLQLEAVRAGRTLLTKTARGRVIRLKLLRQLKAAKQADPKALTAGGAERPLAEQLVLALSGSRIALPEILKPVQTDRPKTEKDWFARVTSPGGDPAAGRRIFFHSQGSGCYKCHTVGGRGGEIGPNLSLIARTMDRKKLAESILIPSKEIAPQFTTWAFLMESGKVFTGMILGDTRNKIQRIGTTEGKVIVLPADKIEERTPQNISLMPRELVDRMTATELRDLLAYLETLK